MQRTVFCHPHDRVQSDARWLLHLAATRRISCSAAISLKSRPVRHALGQRSRLVDHQRVDLVDALDRFGIPDEHAGMRAPPDGDHDRYRRRQPESTGAGDDEYADGVDQRTRIAAPARTRPSAKRDQRDDNDAGRTSRTPDRRAAGSAPGYAGPPPPCGRSGPAACPPDLPRG